jgi:hypothetical protein
VATLVVKMGPDRWKAVDGAEDPVEAIQKLGLSDLEAYYRYEPVELDYVAQDGRFAQSAKEAYLAATRGGLIHKNPPRSVKLLFEVPGTRDKRQRVRKE